MTRLVLLEIEYNMFTYLGLGRLTDDTCHCVSVSWQCVYVGLGSHVPNTRCWVSASRYQHVYRRMECQCVHSTQMSVIVPNHLYHKNNGTESKACATNYQPDPQLFSCQTAVACCIPNRPVISWSQIGDLILCTLQTLMGLFVNPCKILLIFLFMYWLKKLLKW